MKKGQHGIRIALALALALLACFLWIAAWEPQTVSVPVLMYHSLYKNPNNKWIITPEAFEQDLKYMRNNGYTAVNASQLIAFVFDGEPLPEKPVLITFDDGCYNNLVYALPLLEEYDSKMLLSVIGDPIELWTEAGELDERNGHLSYGQISQMLETGRVELGNHTSSLHHNANGRKGCCRKPGESEDEYRSMLTSDVQKLQDNLLARCGFTPDCFTYPFGRSSDEAKAIIRQMGFKMTLSCASGTNHLSYGDTESLFDMKRNNRTPSDSAQEILSRIEAAQKE